MVLALAGTEVTRRLHEGSAKERGGPRTLTNCEILATLSGDHLCFSLSISISISQSLSLGIVKAKAFAQVYMRMSMSRSLGMK